MASNSITDYLVNVAKSIKYAAIETIEEEMPVTGQFIASNKETVKEMYKSILDSKLTISKILSIQDNVVFKKANQMLQNIKTDIRSGQFYHEERNDEMSMLGEMMSMMGGETGDFMAELNSIMSMDFPQDGSMDYNENPQMLVTKGDAMVASALFRSQKISTNCIGKVVTNLHEHGTRQQRAIANMQFMQGQRSIMINQAGWSSMVEGFNHLINFNNNVIKTHAENSKMFYEQITQIAQESNAVLKSIHEIHQKVNRGALENDKNPNESDSTKQVDSIDFGELFANGFNLARYNQILSSRFEKTPINMMYSMLKMLPVMMQKFVDNPLHEAAKYMVKGIIGGQLNYAMKQFDKMIFGAFQTGLARLYDYGKRNKDTMLGKIAGFFGVKQERDEIGNVDLSKYDKAAMSWNGKAQKALVEVIPSYLSRIEAAVSGHGERLFNFDTGKWSSIKELRLEKIKLERDTTEEAIKNIRPHLNAQIANLKKLGMGKDQLDKLSKGLSIGLQAMVEHGNFAPEDINEHMERYGGAFAPIFLRMMESAPTTILTGLTNDIGNANRGRNKKIQSMLKNNSFMTSLFNGAVKGEVRRAPGLGTIDTTPVDLTSLKDSRGKTLYDYQSLILRELFAIRQNGGFGGGPGNLGGNNPPPSGNGSGNLNPYEGFDEFLNSAESTAGFYRNSTPGDKKVNDPLNEFVGYDRTKISKYAQGMYTYKPKISDKWVTANSDDKAIQEIMNRLKKVNPELAKKLNSRNITREVILAEAGFLKENDFLTSKREDLKSMQDIYKNLSSFNLAEALKDPDSQEAKNLIQYLTLVSDQTAKTMKDKEIKSNKAFFDFTKDYRDTSKYHALPKGVRVEDDIITQLLRAGDLGQKMDVVKHNIDALMDSPRMVLAGVLGQADRAVYNLLFGKDTGEVDEKGQPILGLFNKMKAQLDDHDNKVNGFFDSVLKSVKEAFGKDGMFSWLNDIIKSTVGFDLSGTMNSIKKKGGNVLTAFADTTTDTVSGYLRHLKQSFVETGADLGLYNDKGGKQIGAHDTSPRIQTDLERQKAEEKKKAKEEADKNSTEDDKESPTIEQHAKGTTSTGKGKDSIQWAIISPGEAYIPASVKATGKGKIVKNVPGTAPKLVPLEKGSTILNANENPWNPRHGTANIAGQARAEKSLAKRLGVESISKFAKGTKKYANQEGIDDIAYKTALQDLYKLGLDSKELNAIIDAIHDGPEMIKEIHDQVLLNQYQFKGMKGWQRRGIDRVLKSIEKALSKDKYGHDKDSLSLLLKGVNIKDGQVVAGQDVKQENLNKMLNTKKTGLDYRYFGALRDIMNEAGMGDQMPSDEELGRKEFADRNGPITGVRNFSTQAFGTDPKKALQLAEDYMFENKKDLAKGGIGGAILSTIFPLGGPLMGALVGAGIQTLRKSDTFNDYVFGTAIKDENGNITGRHDNGLISKEVQKIYEKYSPDAKKYGTVGAIAGLITPFGPLGGALIGAGASIVKNNYKLNQFIFGDNGGLLNKDRKAAIKRAFPHIGAAMLGTFFLGPFGILGNAILGTGIGMLSTMEIFKKLMLGPKDKDGIRRGGIAGAIRRQITEPFKETMNEVREQLGGWFRDRIFNPVAEGLKPLGRVVSGAIQQGVKYLFDKGEKILFGRQAGILPKFISNRLNELFGGIRMAGGLGKFLTKTVFGNAAEKLANWTERGGKWAEETGVKTFGITAGHDAGELSAVYDRLGDHSHVAEGVRSISKLQNPEEYEELLKLLNLYQSVVFNGPGSVQESIGRMKNREIDILSGEINKYADMHGKNAAEQRAIAEWARKVGNESFFKDLLNMSHPERNTTVEQLLGDKAIDPQTRIKLKEMLMGTVDKFSTLDAKEKATQDANYTENTRKVIGQALGLPENLSVDEFNAAVKTWTNVTKNEVDKNRAKQWEEDKNLTEEEKAKKAKEKSENSDKLDENAKVVDENTQAIKDNTAKLQEMIDWFKGYKEVKNEVTGQITQEAVDDSHVTTKEGQQTIAVAKAAQKVNQVLTQDMQNKFDKKIEKGLPNQETSTWDKMLSVTGTDNPYIPSLLYGLANFGAEGIKSILPTKQALAKGAVRGSILQGYVDPSSDFLMQVLQGATLAPFLMPFHKLDRKEIRYGRWLQKGISGLKDLTDSKTEDEKLLERTGNLNNYRDAIAIEALNNIPFQDAIKFISPTTLVGVDNDSAALAGKYKNAIQEQIETMKSQNTDTANQGIYSKIIGDSEMKNGKFTNESKIIDNIRNLSVEELDALKEQTPKSQQDYIASLIDKAKLKDQKNLKATWDENGHLVEMHAVGGSIGASPKLDEAVENYKNVKQELENNKANRHSFKVYADSVKDKINLQAEPEKTDSPITEALSSAQEAFNRANEIQSMSKEELLAKKYDKMWLEIVEYGKSQNWSSEEMMRKYHEFMTAITKGDDKSSGFLNWLSGTLRDIKGSLFGLTQEDVDDKYKSMWPQIVAMGKQQGWTSEEMLSQFVQFKETMRQKSEDKAKWNKFKKIVRHTTVGKNRKEILDEYKDILPAMMKYGKDHGLKEEEVMQQYNDFIDKMLQKSKDNSWYGVVKQKSTKAATAVSHFFTDKIKANIVGLSVEDIKRRHPDLVMALLAEKLKMGMTDIEANDAVNEELQTLADESEKKSIWGKTKKFIKKKTARLLVKAIGTTKSAIDEKYDKMFPTILAYYTEKGWSPIQAREEFERMKEEELERRRSRSLYGKAKNWLNDQKEKLMGSSRAKLQKKYSAQFQELISYGSKNNLPLNQILEVWDNFLDEQEKASFNKSIMGKAWQGIKDWTKENIFGMAPGKKQEDGKEIKEVTTSDGQIITYGKHSDGSWNPIQSKDNAIAQARIEKKEKTQERQADALEEIAKKLGLQKDEKGKEKDGKGWLSKLLGFFKNPFGLLKNLITAPFKLAKGIWKAATTIVPIVFNTVKFLTKGLFTVGKFMGKLVTGLGGLLLRNKKIALAVATLGPIGKWVYDKLMADDDKNDQPSDEEIMKDPIGAIEKKLNFKLDDTEQGKSTGNQNKSGEDTSLLGSIKSAGMNYGASVIGAGMGSSILKNHKIIGGGIGGTVAGAAMNYYQTGELPSAGDLAVDAGINLVGSAVMNKLWNTSEPTPPSGGSGGGNGGSGGSNKLRAIAEFIGTKLRTFGTYLCRNFPSWAVGIKGFLEALFQKLTTSTMLTNIASKLGFTALVGGSTAGIGLLLVQGAWALKSFYDGYTEAPRIFNKKEEEITTSEKLLSGFVCGAMRLIPGLGMFLPVTDVLELAIKWLGNLVGYNKDTDKEEKAEENKNQSSNSISAARAQALNGKLEESASNKKDSIFKNVDGKASFTDQLKQMVRSVRSDGAVASYVATQIADAVNFMKNCLPLGTRHTDGLIAFAKEVIDKTKESTVVKNLEAEYVQNGIISSLLTNDQDLSKSEILKVFNNAHNTADQLLKVDEESITPNMRKMIGAVIALYSTCPILRETFTESEFVEFAKGSSLSSIFKVDQKPKPQQKRIIVTDYISQKYKKIRRETKNIHNNPNSNILEEAEAYLTGNPLVAYLRAAIPYLTDPNVPKQIEEANKNIPTYAEGTDNVGEDENKDNYLVSALKESAIPITAALATSGTYAGLRIKDLLSKKSWNNIDPFKTRATKMAKLAGSAANKIISVGTDNANGVSNKIKDKVINKIAADPKSIAKNLVGSYLTAKHIALPVGTALGGAALTDILRAKVDNEDPNLNINNVASQAAGALIGKKIGLGQAGGAAIANQTYENEGDLDKTIKKLTSNEDNAANNLAKDLMINTASYAVPNVLSSIHSGLSTAESLKNFRQGFWAPKSLQQAVGFMQGLNPGAIIESSAKTEEGKALGKMVQTGQQLGINALHKFSEFSYSPTQALKNPQELFNLTSSKPVIENPTKNMWRTVVDDAAKGIPGGAKDYITSTSTEAEKTAKSSIFVEKLKAGIDSIGNSVMKIIPKSYQGVASTTIESIKSKIGSSEFLTKISPKLATTIGAKAFLQLLTWNPVGIALMVGLGFWTGWSNSESIMQSAQISGIDGTSTPCKIALGIIHALINLIPGWGVIIPTSWLIKTILEEVVKPLVQVHGTDDLKNTGFEILEKNAENGVTENIEITTDDGTITNTSVSLSPIALNSEQVKNNKDLKTRVLLVYQGILNAIECIATNIKQFIPIEVFNSMNKFTILIAQEATKDAQSVQTGWDKYAKTRRTFFAANFLNIDANKDDIKQSFITGNKNTQEVLGISSGIANQSMKTFAGIINTILTCVPYLKHFISIKQIIQFGMNTLAKALGFTKNDIETIKKEAERKYKIDTKESIQISTDNKVASQQAPSSSSSSSSSTSNNNSSTTENKSNDDKKKDNSSSSTTSSSSDSNKPTSSDSIKENTSSSFVDKVKQAATSIKNTLFGSGKEEESKEKYGGSRTKPQMFYSQYDPEFKKLSFNSKADTKKQSWETAGCGPATALNSLRDQGILSGTPQDAMRHIIGTGNKEKNGGSMPAGLSSYIRKQGGSAETIHSKSQAIKAHQAGKTLMVMGQGGPFSKGVHWMTFKVNDKVDDSGIIGTGRAGRNMSYNKSDVLKHASQIIAVGGRRSRYGRGRDFEYGGYREGGLGANDYPLDTAGSKKGNNDAVKDFAKTFISNNLGLSNQATSAMLGMIKQETGFDPVVLQGSDSWGKEHDVYLDKDKADDFPPSRPGQAWGLYQMTDERQKAMIKDARDSKFDPNSVEAQLRYFYKETSSGSEKGKFEALQKAKTVDEANDAVQKIIRCGVSGQRNQWAKEFLEKEFGGKTSESKEPNLDAGTPTSSDNKSSTSTTNKKKSRGLLGAIGRLASAAWGAVVNLFKPKKSGGASSASDDSGGNTNADGPGGAAQYVDTGHQLDDAATYMSDFGKEKFNNYVPTWFWRMIIRGEQGFNNETKTTPPRNNPGGMDYASWMKEYGATSEWFTDTGGQRHNGAKFNSIEDGLKVEVAWFLKPDVLKEYTETINLVKADKVEEAIRKHVYMYGAGGNQAIANEMYDKVYGSVGHQEHERGANLRTGDDKRKGGSNSSSSSSDKKDDDKKKDDNKSGSGRYGTGRSSLFDSIELNIPQFGMANGDDKKDEKKDNDKKDEKKDPTTGLTKLSDDEIKKLIPTLTLDQLKAVYNKYVDESKLKDKKNKIEWDKEKDKNAAAKKLLTIFTSEKDAIKKDADKETTTNNTNSSSSSLQYSTKIGNFIKELDQISAIFENLWMDSSSGTDNNAAGSTAGGKVSQEFLKGSQDFVDRKVPYAQVNPPTKTLADCSGMIKVIGTDVGFGKELPRTADEQAVAMMKKGALRIDKKGSSAKPGELVFFCKNPSIPDDVNTEENKKKFEEIALARTGLFLHHVGVAVGNDKFNEEQQTGVGAVQSSLSTRDIVAIGDIDKYWNETHPNDSPKAYQYPNGNNNSDKKDDDKKKDDSKSGSGRYGTGRSSLFDSIELNIPQFGMANSDKGADPEEDFKYSPQAQEMQISPIDDKATINKKIHEYNIANPPKRYGQARNWFDSIELNIPQFGMANGDDNKKENDKKDENKDKDPFEGFGALSADDAAKKIDQLTKLEDAKKIYALIDESKLKKSENKIDWSKDNLDTVKKKLKTIWKDERDTIKQEQSSSNQSSAKTFSSGLVGMAERLAGAIGKIKDKAVEKADELKVSDSTNQFIFDMTGYSVNDLVKSMLGWSPASTSSSQSPSSNDTNNGGTVEGTGKGLKDAQDHNIRDDYGPIGKVTKISIHYTAGDGTVETIDATHKGNGWKGINYHFIIYKDGSVHKGVPETSWAPHTARNHEGCIGISSVLNAGEKPSDEQKASLEQVIADVCYKYNLSCDTNTIKGHKDWDKIAFGYVGTACPGDVLYGMLGDIISTAKTLKPTITEKASSNPTPFDSKKEDENTPSHKKTQLDSKSVAKGGSGRHSSLYGMARSIDDDLIGNQIDEINRSMTKTPEPVGEKWDKSGRFDIDDKEIKLARFGKGSEICGDVPHIEKNDYILHKWNKNQENEILEYGTSRNVWTNVPVGTNSAILGMYRAPQSTIYNLRSNSYGTARYGEFGPFAAIPATALMYVLRKAAFRVLYQAYGKNAAKKFLQWWYQNQSRNYSIAEKITGAAEIYGAVDDVVSVFLDDESSIFDPVGITTADAGESPEDTTLSAPVSNNIISREEENTSSQYSGGEQSVFEQEGSINIFGIEANSPDEYIAKIPNSEIELERLRLKYAEERQQAINGYNNGVNTRTNRLAEMQEEYYTNNPVREVTYVDENGEESNFGVGRKYGTGNGKVIPFKKPAKEVKEVKSHITRAKQPQQATGTGMFDIPMDDPFNPKGCFPGGIPAPKKNPMNTKKESPKLNEDAKVAKAKQKQEDILRKINSMGFDELQDLVSQIDMTKVPEYNRVDFEQDDLGVVRSKLKAIIKNEQGTDELLGKTQSKPGVAETDINKQYDKETGEVLSNIKAPNGKYYTQNDIDYLLHNGYSKETAIAFLSKHPKYNNTEQNNENDENLIDFNDPMKTIKNFKKKLAGDEDDEETPKAKTRSLQDYLAAGYTMEDAVEQMRKDSNNKENLKKQNEAMQEEAKRNKKKSSKDDSKDKSNKPKSAKSELPESVQETVGKNSSKKLPNNKSTKKGKGKSTKNESSKIAYAKLRDNEVVVAYEKGPNGKHIEQNDITFLMSPQGGNLSRDMAIKVLMDHEKYTEKYEPDPDVVEVISCTGPNGRFITANDYDYLVDVKKCTKDQALDILQNDPKYTEDVEDEDDEEEEAEKTKKSKKTKKSNKKKSNKLENAESELPESIQETIGKTSSKTRKNKSTKKGKSKKSSSSDIEVTKLKDNEIMVATEKGPNGKHIEQDDIDYLMSPEGGGLSRDMAIKTLMKDPKYTEKYEPEEGVVEVLAYVGPNGKHITANDYDYLIETTKCSKDEAIKILQNDKKYTEEIYEDDEEDDEEEEAEKTKKSNKTAKKTKKKKSSLKDAESELPESVQKSTGKNRKLPNEKKGKSKKSNKIKVHKLKDNEVLVSIEKAPNGRHYLQNDIDFLMSAEGGNYSREMALKILSENERYTKKYIPDKDIVEVFAYVGPNGKHITANDYDYLVDVKKCTKDQALAILMKSKTYTEELDDEDEDEDEEENSSGKKKSKKNKKGKKSKDQDDDDEDENEDEEEDEEEKAQYRTLQDYLVAGYTMEDAVEQMRKDSNNKENLKKQNAVIEAANAQKKERAVQNATKLKELNSAEPVIKEKGPNGRNYTKNDYDALIKAGYSKENALKELGKRPKYRIPVTDPNYPKYDEIGKQEAQVIDKLNKSEPVVKEKGPNGRNYTENDIKYLMSIGHTRESAIKALSKHPKYTMDPKDPKYAKYDEKVKELLPYTHRDAKEAKERERQQLEENKKKNQQEKIDIQKQKNKLPEQAKEIQKQQEEKNMSTPQHQQVVPRSSEQAQEMLDKAFGKKVEVQEGLDNKKVTDKLKAEEQKKKNKNIFTSAASWLQEKVLDPLSGVTKKKPGIQLHTQGCFPGGLPKPSPTIQPTSASNEIQEGFNKIFKQQEMKEQKSLPTPIVPKRANPFKGIQEGFNKIFKQKDSSQKQEDLKPYLDKIPKMGFDELQDLASKIDMNNVPEYNRVDFEKDDLGVVRDKLITIIKNDQYKPKKEETPAPAAQEMKESITKSSDALKAGVEKVAKESQNKADIFQGIDSSAKDDNIPAPVTKTPSRVNTYPPAPNTSQPQQESNPITATSDKIQEAILMAQNKTNELLASILTAIQSLAGNKSEDQIVAKENGKTLTQSTVNMRAMLSGLGGGSSAGIGDKFMGLSGDRSKGDSLNIVNAMLGISTR